MLPLNSHSGIRPENYEQMIDDASEAGMKYWFLEQDNCRTHTPMESIRISRDYFLAKIAK